MARLLVLFFASGCAALIYETVWFYLVQLVVGASSWSIAVILCAFMGGMALGSWLLPKVTPKGAHPFRVVAALEAGIALFGIAIPIALPYIQQVYLTLAEPGAGAITLRAVVCFLVLTPPTMLMGATLPAIARWRLARRHGAGIGRLALHGQSGRRRHRNAARGLLSAARLRHRDRDSGCGDDQHRHCDSHYGESPPARRHARRMHRHRDRAARGTSGTFGTTVPVYVAAAMSGFTALGAEVVWTRQLSLLFGASVYTFSLILAIFSRASASADTPARALARRSHAAAPRSD